jgi:hypothetical protein
MAQRQVPGSLTRYPWFLNRFQKGEPAVNDQQPVAQVERLLDLHRRESAELLGLIKSEQELRNLVTEAFEGTLSLYQQTSSVVDTLTLRINALLKARSHNWRWTIAIGVAALILGVLTLWDSASIGVGFHQNFSIALGGALITFVLVEIFLHRMLEITSAEAKKAEEYLKKGAPHIEMMRKQGNEYQVQSQVFLNTIQETDAKTGPAMDRLRTNLLGQGPTTVPTATPPAEPSQG